MSEIRPERESLEYNLRIIYKKIISENMTEANFNGFLQALMDLPLNKGLLPSGCEEMQKQLRRGYIEGRKLMKSYFSYDIRDIKFSFSKN